MKEGKYRSVPVFIFFDQEMRELGHFIERPARVTAEMMEATAKLVAAHPEISDLGGSFDTMSDSSKKLRFQMLRALRDQRAAGWNSDAARRHRGAARRQPRRPPLALSPGRA